MQKNKTTIEQRFEEYHNTVKTYPDNDDWCTLSDEQILDFISQEHTQWEKELKIGDLRQWLNEDRIVDPNKMIKNEDIKIMLGLKSECLCLEDNKMTQALCPIHGKQGK